MNGPVLVAALGSAAIASGFGGQPRTGTGSRKRHPFGAAGLVQASPRAMPITKPHEPLMQMMNRTPAYRPTARITAQPDCCRSSWPNVRSVLPER